MTTIHINDLHTLRERFAALGKDALFRGQTKHYEDNAGAPSITTSFARHGCVPPKMLKWQHYAKELFRVLSDPPIGPADHYADAILQHYGWRSFYVDVTKSSAVAAWFAAHSYIKNKPIVEMAEDVNEGFVMLTHNVPKYIPAEKSGTIYVISKDKAQSEGARFVDLTDISCEDTKPRFHAQHGGLIGPFSRLPPCAVLERWVVPCAVLREYATQNGLNRTEDLFPAREKDIFLSLLLAVPWEHVGGKPSDPIFARGLDIPEYDFRPTRRYMANTAFGRRAWLSRANHLGASSLLRSAIRFGMSEEAFYYHVDKPRPGFECLIKLVRDYPAVVIEIDGIVRRPEGYRGDQYAKGIIVHRASDNLVHISELAVRHPGAEIHGARALAPWTYRIDENGALVRHTHKDDCPCNNPGWHDHLFRYAQVVELLLSEGSFCSVSELEYRHKDVSA